MDPRGQAAYRRAPAWLALGLAFILVAAGLAIWAFMLLAMTGFAGVLAALQGVDPPPADLGAFWWSVAGTFLFWTSGVAWTVFGGAARAWLRRGVDTARIRWYAGYGAAAGALALGGAFAIMDMAS